MITVHFIAHPHAADPASATVQAKPGKTLMQAAQSAGVEGIAADCGGSLTCATCHVMVREPWASLLPAANAEERGMLDFTSVAAQPNSRLACQLVLTESLDGLTVDLPESQY